MSWGKMTKHQKEDTSIPTPRYEIVDNRPTSEPTYYNEPKVTEQPKQVPVSRRSDPDKEYDRPSTTIKHHQTPLRPTNTPTATEPPSTTGMEQLDPNDPDYIDKRLKQLSDEIDRKKAAKNK